MEESSDNPTARETQNNPDVVDELQCHSQNSEVVKHGIASSSKKGLYMMELMLSRASKRLKTNGTTDNLPGGSVIIRKQHSRAVSDCSIELATIEGSPGMNISTMSPTKSESSSEEEGLLIPIMTPTFSRDGMTSTDEKLHVADHAVQSETTADHTWTDENLSRTASSTWDCSFLGTWTQSPTPSPVFDSCDIIQVVPRPEFPIQVYEGPPPPYPQEAQNRSIRWVHETYHFAPYAQWLKEPSYRRIRDTLRPHLDRLGYESASVEIAFLSEGGFHKVYTITTPNQETKQLKSFVLRIPLPADPYFKTESDVATTEIVRHTTNVPVPVIYAYDSSSDNPLGFEWILMEKINGEPMFDYWRKMDYDSKLRFTKLVANWNAQLANIVSKKIGAIYIHYTATELQFYVGRCVNSIFTQESRLSYDVYRGPFKTPADFYASVLAVTAQDVDNLRYKNRAGLMRDARYQFLDRIWTMRNRVDDDEINEWQEKREKDLEILSTAIEALQERLPALCERLPAVDSSTRLSHHDLSLDNVLVDENGMPVTLLDWESSELRPLVFLADFPIFLDGSELYYEPQPHIIPSTSKLRYDLEEIKAYEAQNERVYLENLDIYVKQKLRTEYQAELRRLNSPLQDANWEKFGEDLWRLYNSIIFIWEDTEDIVKWVESQF